MSARDRIFRFAEENHNGLDLWLYPETGYFIDDPKEALDGLLDAYAHELAEKIRNSEELRDLTDDHMGDCNAAADLIDPAEDSVIEEMHAPLTPEQAEAVTLWFKEENE